ncbi:xaa-Pro aminopeptidase 2 [Rhinophrynus dorsalis]
MEEYNKEIKNKKKKFGKDNLSKDERRAMMKFAKEKNITIREADKGGAIIVQNTGDYIKEGYRLLGEGDFYMKLTTDPSGEYANMLDSMLKRAFERNIISKEELEFIQVKHHEPAFLYHNPKIHKSTSNPPGRPIVAGINSMTSHLSQYIDHFLQEYVVNLPSYIRDSQHVLEKMEEIQWQPGYRWVSMNVVSLYTNIQHHLGIQALAHYLDLDQEKTMAHKEFILRSVLFMLEHNFFIFQGEFFLQCRGTAMGTKFAPSYANLFMGLFEKEYILDDLAWREGLYIDGNPYPYSSCIDSYWTLLDPYLLYTPGLITYRLEVLYGCAEGFPKEPRDTTIRNCSSNPPYIPPTVQNTTHQLSSLRQQMTLHNISAYIIPGTDAHLGEYIADREKRRKWLTGFTGSSGTAVVTMTRAAVFTDSRYWTQAEREMDCSWELQKTTSSNSIVTWIQEELKSGEKIGFDPFLFSIDEWESYSKSIQGSGRILLSIPTNLVDKVWGDQRPPLPNTEIYSLRDEFVGSSWQEKVLEIRRQMNAHSQKPTAVLLSALEETAWLFNLRGQDIPYNPFFYSYTLLTLDSVWLFVNVSRITPMVQENLNTNCPGSTCVKFVDYEHVRDHVTDYVKGDVKIWIGTEYTNYGLYEIIPKEKLVAEDYSPVMKTKAVKNDREQELLKKCHIRDAVAVIQYLVWLEKNVPKGTVNEENGGRYVDALRAKQAHFQGPSFATISAGGLNAALAHYSATNETNRKLTPSEMYLVDSGGQYFDGTTDITRTVHWGTPSDFEKEAYTRVLMGNIELTRLIFPAQTSGRVIEAFARQALWEVGLNYGHGTGHGIGNFFSVHEWPVGFQSSNIAMSKGMFTSIEPGYYHDGHFGIRIEDIALVVEADTKHMFGGQPYLTFEAVSLVPYDRNLIDTSIMTQNQINYVDTYYKKIREIVGSELQYQNLHEEYNWLEKNTKPLSSGTFSKASFLVLSLTFVANQFLKQGDTQPLASENLFSSEVACQMLED